MDTAQGLPPLAVGARLDEFEIVDVVEQARYVITYLARDRTGTEVLIKELLPAEFALREDGMVRPREAEDRTPLRFWLRSFLDKGVLLQKLNHPGLIRVIKQFEANGTGYCVVERIAGESLAAILQREGTLSEAQLRRLLAPVLGGLEQAHAVGLLHRDIRPENLLVRPDDSAVLCDFGELRAPIRFKTRTAFTSGAPPYAAPEEFYMAGPHGPWTDIYALGATAYRVLSGQAPPDARSRATGPALASLATAGRVRCSEAMVAAVDGALQLSAEMRPQSVSAWRMLLQGGGEEAAEPATEFPPPVSPQARPGGRPGLLPLLAIVGLVAAAGAYFVLHSHPTAETAAAVTPQAAPDQAAPAAAPAASAAAVPAPAASPDGAPVQDQAGLDRLAQDLMNKEKKVDEAQKQLQEQQRQLALQQASARAAVTGKDSNAAAPPPPSQAESEAAERLKQLQGEVERLRQEKAAQSAQVALSAPAGAAPAAAAGVDWSTWYRQATGTVRQKLQYPPSSLEAGEEGDITVKVRLRRDGGIVSTDLQKRSGFPALNQEAINVFGRVGRFAPLPADYQPNSPEVDVNMPINFKMAE